MPVYAMSDQMDESPREGQGRPEEGRSQPPQPPTEPPFDLNHKGRFLYILAAGIALIGIVSVLIVLTRSEDSPTVVVTSPTAANVSLTLVTSTTQGGTDWPSSDTSYPPPSSATTSSDTTLVFPTSSTQFIPTTTTVPGTTTSRTTSTTKASAPQVVGLANWTVDEGLSFSGKGRFSDSSANGPWTGTVDWGDGRGENALNINSDKSFFLSHTYANNKSDLSAYTITVKVRNRLGLTGKYTSKMGVRNLAPKLSLPGDASAKAGQTFSWMGWLSDPAGDSDKPWTLTVDYGDGSGEKTLQYNEQTLYFALQHAYATPKPEGSYTITVKARDKDGGVGKAEMHVTVTAP